MWRGVGLLCLAGAMPMACDKPVGEGPCVSPKDCRSDFCFEMARRSYCTDPCGNCPDGMYCDTHFFATAGVALCVAGEQGSTPTMPPRLLCRTDDECPRPLICGESAGQHQCGIPCQADADCRPLAIGRDTFAYLGCQKDPATRRNLCLPRPECWANLLVCLSVPQPPP